MNRTDDHEMEADTMLAAGALAMFATDVAFKAPPPNRPKRPERTANRRARLLGAARWLRGEIAGALDDGAWLPQLTRRYPY